MSIVNETETIPELHFGAGLPGFPDAHRFALVYWGDDTDSAFSILTCLDQEGLEFLVVPPIMFFPLYAPEIDDATVERLGIETAEDALLLVIVKIPEDDPSQATANLMAPIVVNRHTREAVQAVLSDGEHDLHAPLLRG